MATGAEIAVGADRLTPPEVFLDAVLGYGRRGAPQDGAAELIAAAAGARVLSLDVPSRHQPASLAVGADGDPHGGAARGLDVFKALR